MIDSRDRWFNKESTLPKPTTLQPFLRDTRAEIVRALFIKAHFINPDPTPDTTKLTNQYTSWQRGSSPAFELKLLIRYPEQTIHYRPGFWQTMKWAWIQYLSVLVVFIVVFRSIKTYVFSKQVLFTQCVYPQLKN